MLATMTEGIKEQGHPLVVVSQSSEDSGLTSSIGDHYTASTSQILTHKYLELNKVQLKGIILAYLIVTDGSNTTRIYSLSTNEKRFHWRDPISLEVHICLDTD